MRRVAATLALAGLLVIAGCSGTGELTPEADSPTRDGEPGPATPTPEAGPAPAQDATGGFQWSILRTVGQGVADGKVDRLSVVLSHPTTEGSLDARNTTILLQHDDQSYRLVHESTPRREADGTFTVGDPAVETTLHELQPDDRRVLAIDVGADSGDTGAVGVELTAGDEASVLIRTPNGTTRAVTARIPGSLAGERAVILGGNFRDDDLRDETDIAGQPRVVAGTASRITASGAGVVNLTVTKLPGSTPVDYSAVAVRLTGPFGSSRLVTPARESATAEGHVGLTPVRDADNSFPVLNEDDRVRLTLDLGPDSVAIDDGPLGNSTGTRLGRTFGTRVYMRAGERTRRLDVALPPNASAGPVRLRGIEARTSSFPDSAAYPAVRVLASGSQRLDGGGLTGISLNVRKPPTAAPVDPRNLTVDLRTNDGSYTLVHPSRANASADGHFGVESVFNPDGSSPVLDDYHDLARLRIDLGPQSRTIDDGPLGDSVGETLSPDSVVTVRVQTPAGTVTTRQYSVPG